jgi:uncharacterized Zn finger protein
MSTSDINEAKVRSLASERSFSRGEDYYYQGAVIDLIKRGNMLQAQVEGSSYEPYEVTIELSDRHIVTAYCTCPYDWGGYCKHIVAALLIFIRDPDKVTERPPVTDLLADLERDTLFDLLKCLLSEQPHLVNWVETFLATQNACASTTEVEQPRQRQTPIYVTPFQRQAQHILHPGDYYWGVGQDISNQMSELIDQARPFIKAGDGRNALLILKAITEPLVESWFEYDEEGEMGYLFADLGPLFAEAILSANLSSEERREWANTLTNWQGAIEEYGIDDGFDVAIGATTQGWDWPPLQAVLQGQITDKGAWEDEPPWYADDLTVARLNVLERQGRTTEYLYLAQAEGQTALYLTMLVKLERSDEAVAYAMKYMTSTEEALALAQALEAHNYSQDALKMAEYGLTLFGETLTLARWLRDFAETVDRPDIALKAARTAFEHSYSLKDYQAAEAIAGDEWPSIRRNLLNLLASTGGAYGTIDIYLHEGMIDEAVEAIDRQGYVGYYTLEPVVDAAWQSHPDWVIRQCKKQAEPIMNDGKSKYYHHAARWLEKARKAYLAADRTDEWGRYLESLIQKHARKYSLRPQLEALRVK